MKNNRDIRGVKVRLSESEILNADKSYYNDGKYTIIRRPQANGCQLVASVDISTCKIITFEYAENDDGVRKAVREVNRWMDKCYGGGVMSDKSRHRRKERT